MTGMTQEDMNDYVKYFPREILRIVEYSDAELTSFTTTYDSNYKWEIPYRCRWNFITGLVID